MSEPAVEVRGLDFRYKGDERLVLRDLSLTVHPGIVHALSRGYAAGLRMAFDVNEPSWGFTPLLNRGFPIRGRACTPFIEGVVPIRFQQDSSGVNRTSIGLAVHVGVGF